MSSGRQNNNAILIPVFISVPVIVLLAIVNLTMSGPAQAALMAVLLAAVLVCAVLVCKGIARSRK
ncbi:MULTISPECIES: hypothetical protein [Streptomyces]|uniref:hypothetical protein n=1 Tax=Streptomyces TaxID=1883 RepID=UPI000C27C7E4|nr:hypothetical protein [Streptomyces sp. CB01201]MBX7465457.1 hypothetical protein [Streptomyces sp. MAG02]PJN03587.1 hypothetical protein CG740_09490 [Streptomyces sp. CB01201]